MNRLLNFFPLIWGWNSHALSKCSTADSHTPASHWWNAVKAWLLSHTPALKDPLEPVYLVLTQAESGWAGRQEVPTCLVPLGGS